MGFFDRFKKNKDDELSYDINDVSSRLASKRGNAPLDDSYEDFDKEHEHEKYDRTTPSVLEEVNEEISKKKEEADKINEYHHNYDDKFSYFEEVLHEIHSNAEGKELSEEEKVKLRAIFDEKYASIKNLKEAVKMYRESTEVPDFSTKDLVNIQSLNDWEQDNLFLPYLLELKEIDIATEEELNELKNKYGSGEKLKVGYTQGVIDLDYFGIIDISDNTVFEKSFDKYRMYDRQLIKMIVSEKKERQNEKRMKS